MVSLLQLRLSMPCKRVSLFDVVLLRLRDLGSFTRSGFNMGNDLAVFVTYAAFLVDGNPLTNLLSIGGKTPFTGIDPPQPAIVGGLDTHAVFEGAIFEMDSGLQNSCFN